MLLISGDYLLRFHTTAFYLSLILLSFDNGLLFVFYITGRKDLLNLISTMKNADEGDDACKHARKVYSNAVHNIFTVETFQLKIYCILLPALEYTFLASMLPNVGKAGSLI